MFKSSIENNQCKGKINWRNVTEPFITRQQPVAIVHGQYASIKKGMRRDTGQYTPEPMKADSEKKAENKVLNEIPGLEVDKSET